MKPERPSRKSKPKDRFNATQIVERILDDEPNDTYENDDGDGLVKHPLTLVLYSADTNDRSPPGEFTVIAMQNFSPVCLFQACFLEERKAASRLSPKSRAVRGLADWRRVLDTALVPQSVETACDLQRAACTDVAIEDFAVIAHALDDIIGPVIGQAEVGADRRALFDAEEALDIRVCRILHLVDVLLRDPEFFGVHKRIGGPADDVEPLVVTLANGRAEWLLGDDFRQDDVVVGVLQRRDASA